MGENMIELPKIEDDVLKYYQSEQKRSPVHMNRASSVGYYVPMLDGCVRKGVYERTHWSEKKMWEPATLMIFKEGHRQERHVTEDLLKAGWEIIESQSASEVKGRDGEVLCTLHIDGKIVFTIDDKELFVPVEVKSCHPNIYTILRTLEDFKRKPWTRAYLAQIQIYMLANNMDIALFILKNKSSGQIKTIQVELDYELAEACMEVCEEINDHVKNKTIPERINNRDTCKDCQYNHICLPDLDFGQEIEIGDDPSFEAKIKKYLSMVETKKEAEKLYKDIISPRMRATAKDGTLNLVLGKYHLTGKTSKNGSFRPKIEIVGEEDG
jgi:CRISPR/Cas system-associated exonuclease Cas4 (RecB family)